MRNALLNIGALFGLAVLVSIIIAVWTTLTPPVPRPEPHTCSRTYDRRDAPGSITITWDDPRECRLGAAERQ